MKNLGVFVSILGIATSALAADPARFNASRFGTEGRSLNEKGIATAIREQHVAAGKGYFSVFRPITWDGEGKGFMLPLLKDYDELDSAGISDEGIVVGTAFRPKAFKGFVWTKETGTQPLEAFAAGKLSTAFAISGDRIVGGAQREQGGHVPCVWKRNAEGSWLPEILPSIATQGVARAISPNGKWVGGEEDGKPIVWQDVNGTWDRRIVSAIYYGAVRGINDQGEIAGRLDIPNAVKVGKATAFYGDIETGKITLLNWGEKLGYGESDAMAINRQGTVVGKQSAISGQDSDAFVWVKGDKQPRRFRLGHGGVAIVQKEFPFQEERGPIDGSKGWVEPDERRTVLADISDTNVLLGQTEIASDESEEGDITQMFTIQFEP